MIHVVDGTGGRLMVPLELDAFGIRVATVRAEGTDLVRFERTVPLAPTVGSPSSTEAVTLPQSLAIVPADVGSTGSVRIEVVALRAGRVVQRIERVAAFGVPLLALAWGVNRLRGKPAAPLALETAFGTLLVVEFLGILGLFGSAVRPWVGSVGAGLAAFVTGILGPVGGGYDQVSRADLPARLIDAVEHLHGIQRTA